MNEKPKPFEVIAHDPKDQDCARTMEALLNMNAKTIQEEVIERLYSTSNNGYQHSDTNSAR